MSAHAFVTVAVPFESRLADSVEARLGALGNPAGPAIAAALDQAAFVHFMSLSVVPGEGRDPAHLLLEFSADGEARVALPRLAGLLQAPLVDLLNFAGIAAEASTLAAFLQRHQVEVGPGWFSAAGAVFTGTPGMSVARILRERAFARWIQDRLDATPARGPALAVLEELRGAALRQVDVKWALLAEPVPLLAPQPQRFAFVLPMIASAVRYLLWPLLVVPAILLVASRPGAALSLLAAEIAVTLAFLGIAYRKLRQEEESDAPRDLVPSAERVGAIMALENQTLQNHLAGVSTMKPGWVRRLALRIVFWLLGVLAAHNARPGFLSGIGTIHFARWVLLPGTGKLLFFSNYGGSWASYLEDFIARAHAGLTAVWSNTRDFPKTRNLFLEGASDGDRFKRWARCQQRPTPCWYSAYPDLTTERVRINAAIRHGFAAAATEAEAARWLTQFRFPSPATVESDEIPTLVFGGLSGHVFGHCIVARLDGDARGWLRALQSRVHYGERVPERSALGAAFTAGGLRRLGLDAQALASFPTPFQDGMAAPWRARVLGDIGADAPERWWWGGMQPGGEVDAILLVYATSATGLAAEVAARRRELADARHAVCFEIALEELPPKKDRVLREPFGFVDGISQPLMRGTKRWAEKKHSMNLVEPGELVLGYPDNLGYCAPSPRAGAQDLGRNGSFLVVRQLEQDVNGFRAYLADTARALAADPRVPRDALVPLEDWLGAKMIGRWMADGTSLVRYPHRPGSLTGAPRAPDNDFLFGTEDPDGLRCPFGAHIRRANPRDSLDPGSALQVEISNRHRILRVGRRYAPQNGSPNPGLLFMCVNADIEGQFEFLQQTWMLGSSFHGLENEVDPIVGRHSANDVFTIPTPHGPLRLRGMRDFIRVRGGAYFFMPSRDTLSRLAR